MFSDFVMSDDIIAIKDMTLGWDEIINLRSSFLVNKIESMSVPYLNQDQSEVLICTATKDWNLLQLFYSKPLKKGACYAVNLKTGQKTTLLTEDEFKKGLRMSNISIKNHIIFYARFN